MDYKNCQFEIDDNSKMIRKNTFEVKKILRASKIKVRYDDQINKSVNTYSINSYVKKRKMSFNTISYNAI